MLERNLQSNHDLDCVFQSPDGFLYVQGFRRDNVVQHIQDRVGPLPRLGWVADPDAASPITGISQPFVGALLVRNIAEVQLPASPFILLSLMVVAHTASDARYRRRPLHDRAGGPQVSPCRALHGVTSSAPNTLASHLLEIRCKHRTETCP